MSGPDEFGEFYHRLRQIKDYHKKNPNEIEEPMQMEFLRLEQERQKPTEEMQSETLVECCACNTTSTGQVFCSNISNVTFTIVLIEHDKRYTRECLNVHYHDDPLPHGFVSIVVAGTFIHC